MIKRSLLIICFCIKLLQYYWPYSLCCYIIFLWLNYFMTGSLYLLVLFNCLPNPLPPSLWHLAFCSLYLWVFLNFVLFYRFHILVWNLLYLPMFLQKARFHFVWLSNILLYIYMAYIYIYIHIHIYIHFPGGTVVKNLPASAAEVGDVGSMPGSGRPPGVGNGNPL